MENSKSNESDDVSDDDQAEGLIMIENIAITDVNEI